ncbi:hypothetical protein [Sphingorhabdus lutea]|nr:hypothetical protein [Sphingorhabdus lutea]
MLELMIANWPILVVAFLIGLAIAWWIWGGKKNTAIYDEGEVFAETQAAEVTPPIEAIDQDIPAAQPFMNAAPTDAAAQPVKPVKETEITAEKKIAAKETAPKKASSKKISAKTDEAKAKPAAVKTAKKPAAKTDKTAEKSAEIAAAKPAAKPAAKKEVEYDIPDNLELLKGVGPKLQALLKDMGVTGFTQVAAWSNADIDEVDAKLGNFSGRIRRDNWVDQAKLLAKGDVKAFEKKYGSLGSEIKKK